jgi:hypothetical protein
VRSHPDKNRQTIGDGEEYRDVGGGWMCTNDRTKPRQQSTIRHTILLCLSCFHGVTHVCIELDIVVKHDVPKLQTNDELLLCSTFVLQPLLDVLYQPPGSWDRDWATFVLLVVVDVVDTCQRLLYKYR